MTENDTLSARIAGFRSEFTTGNVRSAAARIALPLISDLEKRVEELEKTLHDIDAVILKESPLDQFEILTSVERRVLRMIEVAFGVE